MNSNTSNESPRGASVLGGGVQDAPTQSAPALLTEGLAKTFNGRTVLHPFTFQVSPGEIHALVGQNGSGKSTFIKILSGYHEPDIGGRALVRGHDLEFGNPLASGRVGLRFVHQDLGLIATSSVLDNLAFTRGYETRWGAISNRAEQRHAKQALEAVGLALDPSTLVSHLSPAEKTGVAIARALDFGGEPASVLVLDEPTAALPVEEVEHLHAMLRSAAAQGVGILYVTHHLDEVFRLADRVSVLRDGYLVESCRVSETDRRSIVHLLVGSELEAVRRSGLGTLSDDASAHVFSVSDLHADFVRGVSFEARSGEIVGIYGLTGSGRESILGAIFGSIPRQWGTVILDGADVPPNDPVNSIAVGLGYVTPDRKTTGSFMHLTASENLMMVNVRNFTRGGFLRTKLESAAARMWFDKLQVSPPDGIGNPQASFSGGNQQKIVIGKWLRNDPKVLLLDDPTQGVDVGAKAQLHRLIFEASRAGTIVIASSNDVEEIAAICDRVLIMREGRIAAELVGDSVNESEINRAFHDVLRNN